MRLAHIKRSRTINRGVDAEEKECSFTVIRIRIEIISRKLPVELGKVV